MSIVNRIVSDPKLEVIADLKDGRIIVRIAVECIEKHPMLSKIRGKSPEIDRLQASMQKTGNTAVYPVLLYASELDGEGHDSEFLHYFIADGHQRVQAALNNGNEQLVAQIITRWTTAEDAFNECVSIQYARFEMKDIDLFSVLREGKLTDQELIATTGKSESTITRMRKVCHYPTVVDLIDKECLTTNSAAGLLDACNKNDGKIQALLRTLETRRDAYQKEADYWANKFKVEGRRPKNRKLADMENLKTYFAKEDLDQWKDVLNSKDPNAIDASGCLAIPTDVTAAKASIRVDDRGTLWEDEVAIYFDGGQKHDDMTLENLTSFRKSLPMIGEQLDAIIKRRRKLEASNAIPMPSASPTIDIKAPAAPKPQSTEMEAE